MPQNRSTDRLFALSDVFRAFAEVTTDYTGLLETVAQKLTDLIGDACVVMLAREDGTWLEPGAACARDAEGAALLRAALRSLAETAGTGLAVRVVQTGTAMLLPVIAPEELAARAQPAFAGAVQQLGIRSFLSVPLEVHGRRLGAVSLFRYLPGSPPFGDRERVFASSITDHAALAISNAQLFASLERELQETKRLEGELRQAQKMEALGRLAGGIAHDFNNLLTVILSYSSMLVRALPVNSREVHSVEQIERAGLRAADLTRQLLAFSRRQVLAPTVLELGATVREMEGMIRRLIGEDIELRIVAGADPCAVLADAGQIEQVVMNLVVNARDAMHGGGTLTLETARVALTPARARDLGVAFGVFHTFSVTDTGVGIDEATKANLFEPFFTTKDRAKGTGLGLSTVMGIVQQSGGAITVDSQPSHGATFRVYLPATEQPVATAVPAAPTTTVERSGERILVVEDETDVRALLCDVLRQAGYLVVAAADGEEALALAAGAPDDIDLLLTDVIMPRMSGRQLAARFLALRPATRVLYISGYTDDKLGHHGVLDPDVSLLQKPITPAQLLCRVRDVLKL